MTLEKESKTSFTIKKYSIRKAKCSFYNLNVYFKRGRVSMCAHMSRGGAQEGGRASCPIKGLNPTTLAS